MIAVLYDTRTVINQSHKQIGGSASIDDGTSVLYRSRIFCRNSAATPVWRCCSTRKVSDRSQTASVFESFIQELRRCHDILDQCVDAKLIASEIELQLLNGRFV